MAVVKVYASKKDPSVKAFVAKEEPKYGTVIVQYLTGDNAGKSTNITSATLKRWWSVEGEQEVELPGETDDVKKDETEATTEFVTKVTPKPKSRQKAVKIDKQEKIDYLNVLCNRYNLTSKAKTTHPDAIRLYKDDVRYGEIKINHTSLVLYTGRTIVLDESKYDFVIDKDSTGHAKIKFSLDDSALEYVIQQLVESEVTKNGKN